jgi:hypothetical protein
MSSRREFLERSSAGAALFGVVGFPLDIFTSTPSPSSASSNAAEEWDVSWPSRITGKHKALFDVAEVESGYGVWRTAAWAAQYRDVMKVPVAQLSPVLVLRHNAIALAMQQSFWDKYGVAKAYGVTHPLTMQPTDRNPSLLDEKDGIPAPWDQLGLHKQLARGVVVLACNLALQDIVETVKKQDGLSDEAARTVTVGGLIPGVILQPSGVFAAVRAQEAGCAYVRAS